MDYSTVSEYEAKRRLKKKAKKRHTKPVSVYVSVSVFFSSICAFKKFICALNCWRSNTVWPPESTRVPVRFVS